MINKYEKETRLAWSYLMTDITACEFITTEPTSDLMCYKVYIFTPGGVLRLDTGASDFKDWWRRKADCIHMIRWYLKNPCRVGTYRPWPLQSIIDNWKHHGLWESRVLEKKLIEMYDGHPQAQISHSSASFPYRLRMQLMMVGRQNPDMGLSPDPDGLI